MGMKRFFANVNNMKDGQIILDGIEHNHIKNVMRMSVGDEVIAVCGDEFDYLCKVQEMAKNKTILHVEKKVKNENNPKIKLTVFQSLIKKQGLELMIQKLTELGVSSFIPFESKFSVVKAKEGKELKLQEISNQSIKQCRRSIPMKVEPACSFKEMVKLLKNYDLVLFANETEGGRKSLKEVLKITDKTQNIAIIIGAEGGFAPEEVLELSKITTSIPLGKRILKAETASIGLAAIIMFLAGEI